MSSGSAASTESVTDKAGSPNLDPTETPKASGKSKAAPKGKDVDNSQGGSSKKSVKTTPKATTKKQPKAKAKAHAKPKAAAKTPKANAAGADPKKRPAAASTSSTKKKSLIDKAKALSTFQVDAAQDQNEAETQEFDAEEAEEEAAQDDPVDASETHSETPSRSKVLRFKTLLKEGLLDEKILRRYQQAVTNDEKKKVIEEALSLEQGRYVQKPEKFVVEAREDSHKVSSLDRLTGIPRRLFIATHCANDSNLYVECLKGGEVHEYIEHGITFAAFKSLRMDDAKTKEKMYYQIKGILKMNRQPLTWPPSLITPP